jgi:hypothetical protein
MTRRKSVYVPGQNPNHEGALQDRMGVYETLGITWG